ncbi:hypothetical protein C8Q78DRAFT_222569 [Trametes maxima]|nr:hypothetical protein C8Q78DRAFT_222569 [Trametes maxima]
MPDLHIDILVAVTPFCDRQTLLVLMTACKTLYHTAARSFLENTGPLCLGGAQDVELFLTFMSPNYPRRWSTLRGLLFVGEGWVLRPGLAQKLSSCIRLAPNLEYLSFENAEATLGLTLDLPLAFASLRKIHSLSLGAGGEDAYRLLQTVHWPLESAKLILHHGEQRWFGSSFQKRMQPMHLFKNASETLRSVECHAWWQCCNPPRQYKTVYPRMESLFMSHCQPTHVAPLMRSYPNLSHLKILGPFSRSVGDEENPETPIHEMCRANLRAWDQAPHRWGRLLSFVGNVPDFYLLGTRCEIKALDIVSYRVWHRRFLPDIWPTARPSRLNLSFHHDPPEQDPACMLECFNHPGLEKLIGLRFMAHVSLPGPLANAGGFLMRLYSGVTLERSNSKLTMNTWMARIVSLA